ncbi:MAG: class I SAM-dependent methyltransferase [Candidatus Borkfalkiaceae bacterium]|nr:class I SAM-dependent methyltransferase [Christensenellaceae bacterium]
MVDGTKNASINQIKILRTQARAAGNPVLRDGTFDFLVNLAEKKRPRKILEVGVNVGLTGAALLLVCPDSALTGIEISESLSAAAKENYKRFGVDSRAKIFTGDASAIIPVLTGKYDLIFLDGPKGHYYEYLPYLKDALNVGGVLFADDVAFHGYIKGDAPRKHSTIKRSIENYLSAVTRDKDFLTRVYDTEDGFCVSEKLDGSNRGNI